MDGEPMPVKHADMVPVRRDKAGRIVKRKAKA